MEQIYKTYATRAIALLCRIINRHSRDATEAKPAASPLRKLYRHERRHRGAARHALLSVLLHNQRSVVTAEAECIRQSSVDCALLSLVESKVEIIINLLVEVIVGMVDGRRNDVILYRLDAEQFNFEIKMIIK